jgi:4-hydroxy-3-methylbut-2-enyl diphosphate reductase
MLSSESLAIAEAVRQAMIRRWGAEHAKTHFRAFDTICSATQERQDALYALLDKVRLDVMLVVGGYNSSNTTHLLEIGLERSVPTYHIQSAACLESDRRLRHQPLHEGAETSREDWLPAGAIAVGITAGASTPNGEIEAVMRRLAGFRGSEIP